MKKFNVLETRYNVKQLESISPKNLRDWGEYIPIGDEMDRLERRWRKATLPFLIEGDRGIGKTLLIHTLAKKIGSALVHIPCSDNTRERHLFGSPQIDEDGSYFNAGAITTAMKALETYDFVTIHLDDVGSLSHEMQVMLLSLLDDRKCVWVNGEEMFVPDGKKLMVVLTTNPSTYSGVNTLIEAVRSRVVGEIWENPDRKALSKILSWHGIPKEEVKEPLLTIASNTHDLRSKNNIDSVLTTRDIKNFIQIYNDNVDDGLDHYVNLEQCIRQTILIKYPDSKEHELIRERCSHTFGVDL
jgi:MoxR-like ATPase